MAKSSCIQHPKREPMVLIRRWHMQFCKGNKCAAALLNFYEYWHNIKLEMQGKHKRANGIATMHGDVAIHDETLLQFHTLEDLVSGLNHLFSKNTLSAANHYLKSLHVISIHANPNPKYTFDRTHYILFHPEVCNRWLETYADEFSSCPNDERTTSDTTSKDIEQVAPPLVDRSSVDSITQEPTLFAEQACNEKFVLNTRNVIVGHRSPHVALSNPTIGIPTPKTVTPYPNNGTYKCKEITSKITTKKAAAKHTVQPIPIEDVASDNSAAAFSFCEEVETHIGTVLTPNQQRYLSCTVDAKWPSLSTTFRGFSQEDVKRAMAHEIENPNTFKQTHTDFRHKLNTLMLEIKRKRWIPASTPSLCLANPSQPNNTSQDDNTDEKKLVNAIERLLRERHGLLHDFERMKEFTSVSDDLKASFQQAIQTVDDALKPLIQTLKALREQKEQRQSHVGGELLAITQTPLSVIEPTPNNDTMNHSNVWSQGDTHEFDITSPVRTNRRDCKHHSSQNTACDGSTRDASY